MIKVVIVEDEEFIRRGMVLATPWERFDCEVIGEASNGAEGLEIINRLKPDLVITDVRMPVMDGIDMITELAEQMQAEYIIVSGYEDFKYAQQAIKLGVKDYLLKPIDDEEFYDTLCKLVKAIKKKKQSNNFEYHAEMIDSKILSFNERYDGKEKYIIQAIHYIKLNYHKEISIKDAADDLYISESYLSRLFKLHTNYTFVEYLTCYRLKIALALLKDYKIKVYEVSEKVGYKDSKYFSVIFKKYVGVSPMEFKYNYAN